ncbi:hypothetical protein MWU52_14540 [Jannaschia sp. S6380]|uniref:hypothetical protein n=1 Tax=Jannaschia sp. S6380 TaxID=2926408 RepID=UPI001FF6BA0A|nr:hypothetical protein [Jannaschia sp. S6380]MCK0168774.1 hypothetical protein [Jannaschia sp. S6380]
MTKFIASAAAALVALAPVVASADSSVRTLNTTKSSGNLEAVGSDTIVVNEAPVLAGGGLSTAAAVGLAAAGLLIVAAIADGSDGSSSTTTD